MKKYKKKKKMQAYIKELMYEIFVLVSFLSYDNNGHPEMILFKQKEADIYLCKSCSAYIKKK